MNFMVSSVLWRFSYDWLEFQSFYYTVSFFMDFCVSHRFYCIIDFIGSVRISFIVLYCVGAQKQIRSLVF